MNSEVVGILLILLVGETNLFRGSVNSLSPPETESVSSPKLPDDFSWPSIPPREENDVQINYSGGVIFPQNDRPNGDGKKERILQFGVLAPQDASFQYAMQKVLPPIMMAVRSERIHSLLPGWKFEINYRDTKCSSTYGPLSAFEFYINKTAGRICLKLIYYTIN